MNLKNLIKEARDMPPFLSQDRPEKVKEIYSALKRDHPDMPAELKARIASRQGKRGSQKQGPPYKAPLTKLKKEARVFGAQTPYEHMATTAIPYETRKKTYEGYLRDKAREEPTGLGKALGVGGGVGAGVGTLLGAGVGSGKGALLGMALGGLSGVAMGALARHTDKGNIERVRKILRNNQVDEAIADDIFGYTQGEKARKEYQGASRHKELMGALNKQASDLRNDIVNRASIYGEPLEKTAAVDYFYQIQKPELDEEALGQQFCKFARVTNIDPWDLALQVADNFPTYAVLSKTAPDPMAREVAEFYMDWVDEMEKTAFIGALARGAGKLTAKITRGFRKARGVTGQGITAVPKGPAKTGFGSGFRESMGRAGGGKLTKNQGRRMAAKKEMASRQAAAAPRTSSQTASIPDPKAQQALKQRLIQRRQASGQKLPQRTTQRLQPKKGWRPGRLGAGLAVGGLGGAGATYALSRGPQPAQQGYY